MKKYVVALLAFSFLATLDNGIWARQELGTEPHGIVQTAYEKGTEPHGVVKVS